MLRPAAPPDRKADHLRIAAAVTLDTGLLGHRLQAPLVISAMTGGTADAAARPVELLGADGLSIHLNPVQEAVQLEGPPDFADLAARA
jgi:isopentenyl diphosphate isomerase/L-lactate dehydrogenase-like FMN-dependent dehydrogenase